MIPISITSSFDTHIRLLGASYHNLGLVTVHCATSDLLLADVASAETHEVALTRPNTGTFGLYCSCPTYREGDLCHHLWATIVEAEASGLEDTLLADFDTLEQLETLPNRPDELDDEYDDEFDDYYYEDEDDDEDEYYEDEYDDASLTIALDSETQEYYRSITYGDGRVHLAPMMPGEYEQQRAQGVAMEVLEIDRARGRLVPLAQSRLPPWRKVFRRSRPNRANRPWRQPRYGGVLHPNPEVTDPAETTRSAPAPVDVTWLRSRPKRSLFYLIDVDKTRTSGEVAIDIMSRQRLKAGGWGKPRGVSQRDLDQVSAPDEKRTLSLIHAAQKNGWDYGYGRAPHYRFNPEEDFWDLILPGLCATGRLFLAEARELDSTPAVSLDDGPAWELTLALEPATGGTAPPGDGDRAPTEKSSYRLRGLLRRGDEVRRLDEPQLILHTGLVFLDNKLARFDHRSAWALATSLRDAGAVDVPADQVTGLLRELADQPAIPTLELPPDLEIAVAQGEPQPWLSLAAHPNGRAVLATPAFTYGDRRLDPRDPLGGIFSEPHATFWTRDSRSEATFGQALLEFGFEPRSARGLDPPLQLDARRMAEVVPALLEAGWKVEAEGHLVRRNGKFKVNVRSNIDWFDLEIGMTFDDTHASLPALLEAVGRGDGMVVLDDGSVGLLPDQWLRQVGLLGALGRKKGDHLRFAPSQAALLDLLLAAQPATQFDKAFERIRSGLSSFGGVEPLEPPATFRGELRDYQKEGLGWFAFLERFHFGGCLADDMGLGKTVQVLAWLESRRTAGRKKRAPTLVVVPRSIVWNWQAEAARFTPNLRVLVHSGIKRTRDRDVLGDTDLVITTYGVLRRDITMLAPIEFDAVVLDEAQAIKNPRTATAKAARLLTSRIRLALSGTPIENHLGELWSLLDFLNPGMLGSSTVFERATREGQVLDASGGGREVLARALRPFILRRTKQQVATDLPPKLEQTLYCELDRRERKLYRELRDHYRQKLLKKSDQATGEGLGRQKIQVLEALLRLRQVACHPGLVDAAYADRSSAKLDLLFEHLGDVVTSGHKVLVFSQFVKLLGLVRKRLDAEGIPYVYLDGRTRNRAAKVDRFQNDPDVPLFLISIKAGGLGLNLTAAEYVFLLDPWWNPAVEAQAIDRTHRIGQQRPVFAYRLITRDTVEEKVIKLQEKKRDLAAAIINADNSLIRDLTPEDLELLLE